MASPIVPGTLRTVCVDGGDAPELQRKVRAALAAAAQYAVVDCTLSGVGTGPRWHAQITFTDTPYAGCSIAGTTVATCVRGGDPAEVNLRIQTVLSNANLLYVALEMAGAGAGRAYMALILQAPLPI